MHIDCLRGDAQHAAVLIGMHLLCLQTAGMTVSEDARLQEVVVINTHLLYPHNACSTIIRLREVHKILEYLQARSALYVHAMRH